MDFDLNLDMERSRILENLPMIMVIGLMLITFLPMIPPEIKSVIMLGGAIFAFPMIYLVEGIARIEASKYFAIEMIIRPTQKRLRLFIKESVEDLPSSLIDATHNIYKTTLEIGEPVKYDPYGKISLIELVHELPWEKRVLGLPGKVTFRGVTAIDHNKLAIMTVWEPKGIKGRLDSRRLEFVPEFIVSDAPRDWNIMANPAELQNGNYASASSNTPLAGEEKLKLIAEIDGLTRRALKAETELSLAEQRNVRTHGFVGPVVNAFYGAIGKVRDVGKLVLEEILTALAAHTDIVEATKEYKPFSLFKLTRNFVILALGGIFLYGVIASADFRLFLSENMLYVIIGVVGVAVIIMYFRGRGK